MYSQDFSHHLRHLQDNIKRQLHHDLPRKLGDIAVRLFKENFQKISRKHLASSSMMTLTNYYQAFKAFLMLTKTLSASTTIVTTAGSC